MRGWCKSRVSLGIKAGHCFITGVIRGNTEKVVGPHFAYKNRVFVKAGGALVAREQDRLKA